MNIITKPHVKDQYIEPGTVLTEDIINLRAFLLGSFWRNEITITNKEYRFCDHWIINNDLDIASKENADTLIKESYDTFK